MSDKEEEDEPSAPPPAGAPPPPPPPGETSALEMEDRLLHAHIECSHGVSTYCILEATLSIARDLGAQHRWIDELEDIMPRIFPGMLKNCYLRDTGNGKVAAHKVDFVPRKISVYLDALNSADQNLLLSPWVRENSKAVLRELKDPTRPSKADPVSFSVGHIVAALWCLDRLRVRSVSCSPVPWSSQPGGAQISPTRLLRQALFVGLPTHFDAESYAKRTTGDGLALLRVLTGVARNPNQPISREPPPLVLRASATGSDDGSADDVITIGLTVGELDESRLKKAADGKGASGDAAAAAQSTDGLENNWQIATDFKQVEANIDDMSPEHLAYCLDLLLQEGAADAWLTPIVMKKGRAAHTLHCLCRATQVDEMLRLMFQNTTTLGIRVHDSLQRMALRRQVISVSLGSGDSDDEEDEEDMVDVKIGYLGESVVSTKAEFDHCYRIASKTGQPIHKISKAAVQKAEEIFAKHGGPAGGMNNKKS